MHITHGIAQLTETKNAVLTIGSFDGVHKGHQEILKRINEEAEKLGGESVLLTFEPHPRMILQGENCDLQLITTLEEKQKLLASFDLNHLVIAEFSEFFSNQSASYYIKSFIWQNIHPKVIVIGYDHQFGKNREGNIELMKKYATKLGFEIIEISKQEVKHIAVSSTKIRRALSRGEVAKANQLLGHAFTLTGNVVSGEQIGTSIGFPTANLNIENPYKLVPANGVYAIRATNGPRRFAGMLNIGNRPTFNGSVRTIEAHLFNCNENLYGQYLTLEFVKFIRGEKKFESKETLAAQILSDQKKIEKLLN